VKYLDFDLDKARQREAERRLQLLGDCAGKKYDADKLKDRAYATRVPFRTLKGWWQYYRSQGLPGLIPQDWTALDEKSQSIVAKRYEQLGELADAETIVVDQIAFWAERNGWLYRRADRWVQRYRVGGLWALAPHNNPDKLRRPKNPKRSLATLDEAALQEAFRRREILGELADKARVSDDEVRARADQTGVSPRTIWNYLRDYRESGFAGLAPRRRSDHGRRHVISDRMVEIILGIRLSKPDWPVRAVYEAACERARLLDEPEPSEWQVRDIINRIPKPVRLLADGRDDEFRNKYRITYRMRFDAQRLVYQIDHTPIDVLVKDIRGQAYRRASGEIRP
jgi:DNA-binding Lrp family transcriptional regulator